MITNASLIFHAPTLVASILASLFSTIAVIKLQQYEPATEKAAKVSSIAAQQLHRTRTTQGSGAIATYCSTGTSFYFLLQSRDTAISQSLFLCFVNLALMSFAFKHINAFWKGSSRVPGVGDYNDAVRATERLISFVKFLIGCWVAEIIFYLAFA